MSIYRTRVKVRFAHCDPAGIIFYPRYFEILNGVIEDWFDGELGYSFNQLLTNLGVGTPMVDVQSEFSKPFRLDDMLDIELILGALGTASATVNVTTKIEGIVHIRSHGVLVCSKRDLSGSVPWPLDIVDKMKTFLA